MVPPAPKLSSTSSSVVWALEGEQQLTPTCTCTLFPGRRNLWLNIRGKEASAPSTFQVSVPLPGVSGGVTGQGILLRAGPSPPPALPGGTVGVAMHRRLGGGLSPGCRPSRRRLVGS